MEIHDLAGLDRDRWRLVLWSMGDWTLAGLSWQGFRRTSEWHNIEEYPGLGKREGCLWLDKRRGWYTGLASCLAPHLHSCWFPQGGINDQRCFAFFEKVQIIFCWTLGSICSVWEWPQILRWNWDQEDDGHIWEKQEGDWHCDSGVGGKTQKIMKTYKNTPYTPYTQSNICKYK